MLQSMFKYHKCGDLKYLKQLLESNSFYMAPRTKMNDMYDCFFSLSEEYIANEIAGTNIFQRNTSNPNSSVRENLIGILHAKIYTGINPGITCFSEKCDNDILWSYYSDSAKGICMEFDFSNEEDIFIKALRKVDYTDDFLINTQSDLNILPFRKKKIFSTENEWRIVYHYGNQRCEFNKTSLKAIYIGGRCKQEDVLEIMNVIEAYEYDIKFHKMYFNYKSNQITFRETNRVDIIKNWPTVVT